PGGHVVTLDIDPEVTTRAAAALQAAGYGDRVTVLTGDGEHGAPGHGPFDAIVITAGAWDLAPSWAAQLQEGGTLVVPLRMNGVPRSIASPRRAGHLPGVPPHPSVFPPLQGLAARPETVSRTPAPGGGHIMLRFEDGAPADPPLPDGILAGEPAVAWSG